MPQCVLGCGVLDRRFRFTCVWALFASQVNGLTMSSSQPPFPESAILSYLGLPIDYTPSPSTEPVTFLQAHLHQLPPHLQAHFSLVTSPKQRTIIPTIRNRRLRYTLSAPRELQFAVARNTWPELWAGRERRGQAEGREEREWAESGFLEGRKGHVGKLADLLGGYEEDREAERVRVLRRERVAVAEAEEFVPEEDTDDEDEDESEVSMAEESAEEATSSFERLIRERFIYGSLQVSCAVLSNMEADYRRRSLLTMMPVTGMSLWMAKMIERRKSGGLTRTTISPSSYISFIPTTFEPPARRHRS